MARRGFFSSYFAVRSYFSLFGMILFKLINGLGIFFSSFLTERQTKFFPYSFKCFYNCVIKYLYIARNTLSASALRKFSSKFVSNKRLSLSIILHTIFKSFPCNLSHARKMRPRCVSGVQNVQNAERDKIDTSRTDISRNSRDKP